MGTTRSTPAMPSSPSSSTPSGSPMAPIAVVSSPGMTSTCTPVVSSRALTASTCSVDAPGAMTIITAARGSEAQALHAALAPAEVVGQLVADGLGHLGLEELGVVAEVADERVAEDEDAVGEEVAGHAVALVHAVGAPAPAAVGDHDGHVLERAVGLQGEIVEGRPDQGLEVVLVAGVEELLALPVVVLGLRDRIGVVPGQPLGPLDHPIELVLGGRVAPAAQGGGGPGRDHGHEH